MHGGLFRGLSAVVGGGLLLVASSSMAAVALVEGENYRLDLYGSARIQAEVVRSANRDQMGSYTGFRDAYSRIGVKGDYAFGQALTLFGQLELPLDLVNWEVQDPFDHSQNLRVAQAGLRGDFGSLAYGKMWMPYYNAIAYPVDMFSSYYSGFATFTRFRLSDSLSYYSPEFSGFSMAMGWSNNNGAGAKDRWQGTLSHTCNEGNTTLAAGVDSLSGDWRIWGLSLTHTQGRLYLGAKLEIHDSDISGAYGDDGDLAANFYVAYTLGKNTFKAMLADVDRYGETVIHLGLDHQFNQRLKFFAEYYREQESAAITTKRGSGDGTWESAFGGGQLFLVGTRFDF